MLHIVGRCYLLVNICKLYINWCISSILNFGSTLMKMLMFISYRLASVILSYLIFVKP
jgi:hypothetical protein